MSAIGLRMSMPSKGCAFGEDEANGYYLQPQFESVFLPQNYKLNNK